MLDTNVKQRHLLGELRSVGQYAFRMVCLCFVLMTLGSTVRATDSGLACPDWPMCFGKLIPTMDIQIFLEWFHRLIAFSLGFFLLGMCWKILRSAYLRKTFVNEICCAIVLFLIQCVLGGLTVLKLLQPSIVSSHLLTALIFFGLLLWIWRRTQGLIMTNSNETPNTAIPRSVRWGLGFGTIMLYIQLGIGGMVSTNNAGLICPDFPTCHGYWFPPMLFLPWVQMGHRYFALVLFAFSIIFYWQTRKIQLPLLATIAIRIFPLLLAIQILLGVFNIFHGLPLWTRIGHHANGIFSFALLFVGTIDLYLGRQKARRYSIVLPLPAEPVL